MEQVIEVKTLGQIHYGPWRIALMRDDLPEPVAIKMKNIFDRSAKMPQLLHTSTDGDQGCRRTLFLKAK
jgi:hypothetical protein